MEASALSAPQAHRLRINLSAPLLRLRTDEQLVALFRAGNEDAFRTIHDRYRVRLFAYVRQMLGGSKSDAEDALQDVFLRAYGALRANDKDVALRAWLYRVAHNRCIDQLRRPIPQAADVYDVSRQPADEPASATERREELRRLVEDVQRLPEQQRSVLLMREMEGLSYADLAAALDVSVPAIKSLLVRARMGLVQAAEARDTDCLEVREDLALAHGRGVRANGRARRHLRDCDGCRTYRSDLRSRQRALAGLSPMAGAGPLSILAKLVGGGGAAGGAAGGSAVAGGGAVVGGSAAAVTATKLAIVVGAAVVTAGGAVEVRSELDAPTHVSARPAKSAPATPRAARAFTAPAQASAAYAAAATTDHGGGTAAASERPAAKKAITVVDPRDARPDVVAPGPTDAAAVTIVPPTTEPASTTTAMNPGGRDITHAVESVTKVLPAAGSVTTSQAGATSQPAATQTTAASGSSSSSTNSSSSTGSGSTTSGSTSSGSTTATGTSSSGTTTTPTGSAAGTGSPSGTTAGS